MTGKQITKMKTSRSLRAAVSFPETILREPERLAKKKNVSVAWMVHYSAEKYVEDQWPLFWGTKGEG